MPEYPTQYDNEVSLLKKILLNLADISGGGSTTSSNISQIGGEAISLGEKPASESLPVVLPTDSIVTANSSFTRPADTTPYTIGDVVGTNPATYLTFTNVVRASGDSGYVTKVRIDKNNATITNVALRLYLYKTAPTPIADNSPFTLLYANASTRVGYVDIYSMSTGGTGSDSANGQSYPVNLPFVSSGSRNLYGVLVALGAYTPTSAGQYTVSVTVEAS